MNGIGNIGNLYSPTLGTITTITRVLKLDKNETNELFYTAFPYLHFWKTTIQNSFDLDKTNEYSYVNDCSTLTKGVDICRHLITKMRCRKIFSKFARVQGTFRPNMLP